MLFKPRLESHLDIDQLALCARALVEELVSVYSLAVVWRDPVNHRLRHTLPTWYVLKCLVLFELQRLTSALFPTGLHCREREIRQVPATLWRTLCRQALPQGPVPHCGASDQLHDDARPQQWQEADDCPHRQARVWDHPPADGRGIELMHSVSNLRLLTMCQNWLILLICGSFLDSWQWKMHIIDLLCFLLFPEPPAGFGERHHQQWTPWGLHPYWSCWYRQEAGCGCFTPP